MDRPAARRGLGGLVAAGLAAGLLAAGGPASAAAPPGTITTVAGGPGHGPPLNVAQCPVGLATAAHGVFAETGSLNVVREYTRTVAGEVVTVGDGADDPQAGSGVPATTAALGSLGGLAFDRAGNTVLTDYGDNVVRVAPARSGRYYGRAMTAGDVYTVAGDGHRRATGDGGPATAAGLRPQAVAVDAAGNLVIADTDNHRIRMVAARTGTFYGQAMTAGDIYTVAGDGTAGFAGDGGPAAAAELNEPAGVAVTGSGGLLIADSLSNRVRMVAATTGTFFGQKMTAGDIYTVAGDGTVGTSGNGIPARSASLWGPEAVRVDGAGNLILIDGNRIRVVPARPGRYYGQAMRAGDIYTVAGLVPGGYSGDGGPALAAHLLGPTDVAVDSAGNLLIADSLNCRVRVVAPRTGRFYGRSMTAGDIYTVAGNGSASLSGNGSPATGAELFTPDGLAVTASGAMIIADGQNCQVRMVAGVSGRFLGQRMRAGDIYAIAGDGLCGHVTDGAPARASRLFHPAGLAVDQRGDVLIADVLDERVDMIAARTGQIYGRKVTAGRIYVVAGNGKVGSSADGGPARSAALDEPGGVAADASGNVLIADGDRIRVVPARSGRFYGQAMTAGHIYTMAGGGPPGQLGDGGPARSATLSDASDVAVDASGNVLIADLSHFRIRVVAARSGRFYGQAMTGGDIYTVAGNGTSGYSGDGGPARSAALDETFGVAAGPAGSVVIADSDNQRVRVVAARSGRLFGLTVTAGDIYTVAGNGINGFAGDGGPATAASLAVPLAVAVTRSGNLLIADSNDRVRLVTG